MAKNSKNNPSARPDTKAKASGKKEKKKMKRIKDVIVLPVEKKMELYKELRFYTNADSQQIKKFLHLKVDVRW